MPVCYDSVLSVCPIRKYCMKQLIYILILSAMIVIPTQAQSETPVCLSAFPETDDTQEIMSVNEQVISTEQFANRIQFESAYNALKLAIRFEVLANDADSIASDSQIQTINREINDPSQLANRVLGEFASDIIVWDYASANNIVVLSEDLSSTIDSFFNITDESPEEREIIIDDFNQRLLINAASQSEILTFFCRQTLYSMVQDIVIGEVTSTLYMNVDHILVSSQEVAQDILILLENGEDFATLAQDLSLDVASAERGGALGWQPAVFFVSEFALAVTQAESNTLITTPVQTPFGWHVIRVNGQEERPVEEDLRVLVADSLFTRWRNQQVAQATISINPEWQSFIPE